jgi:hypothetical protein
MGQRQVNSSVSKTISKGLPGRGLANVSSFLEGLVTVRFGSVFKVGLTTSLFGIFKHPETLGDKKSPTEFDS